MADFRLSHGVKISSDDNPETFDVAGQSKQMVVMWDTGPRKPVQPKRPETPQGRNGDPTYELAKAEFAETLEEYQKDLGAFRQAKKDYEAWQKKYGGPYEMFNVWSCDASDMLDRDPKRYFISASTRGHANAPNRGLPDGMTPGHGQQENLRRAAEGQSDLIAARRADPVFGKQELRGS